MSELTTQAIPPPLPGTWSAGWIRLRGASLTLPAMLLLGFAWTMHPDGRGYGTHEQLDLPACEMMMRTGYPCPTCGLTTSVTAAAHGRVGEALHAHPFGLLLLGGTLLIAACGAAELATGRGAIRRLRPGPWWALIAVGGLLVSWAWLLVSGSITGRWGLH